MTNNLEYTFIPYDIVINGDKDYYLRDCIESMTLEDSLDNIAYKATAIIVSPNVGTYGNMLGQFAALPEMRPGTKCKVLGVLKGSEKVETIISDGVVWEREIKNPKRRKHELHIFDRSIYMGKSQDDMLFQNGTTATQRIQQIATKWGIKVNTLADTKIALAKQAARSETLWSMIQNDLKETAVKNGAMYRLTYNDGLVLQELGVNSYDLEYGVNLLSIDHKQTLDGTTTQVKIVGSAKEGQNRPVINTLKGEVDTLGTLQVIHEDKKTETLVTAENVARHLLCGIQESVRAEAIDINTVRAGDKVNIPGWPGLIVISVQHTCGSPGKMDLELAPDYVVMRKHYTKDLHK